LRGGCFLLCPNCQKKTIYVKSARNRCFYCKTLLDISRKMEKLVIALNNIGIMTVYSCSGHDDGFETGRRSYPYVIVRGESAERGKDLIERYNSEKPKNTNEGWQIEVQRTTLGYPVWIMTPLRKERRSEELCKEADKLAEYIFFNF